MGRGSGWGRQFYETGLTGWEGASIKPSAKSSDDDSTRRRLPRSRAVSRGEELEGLRSHARHLEDDVRRLTERVTELESQSGEKEEDE